MRDAQLLSSTRSPSARSPIHIYCLVVLGCLLAGRGLHAMTSGELLGQLKSPWIWSISIVFHIVGLALCLWLRHLHVQGWAWLIALFPSPILTLLLLAISVELPSTLFGGVPFGGAVLVAVIWTVIVASAAELMNRVGATDSEFAVDFAALSNTTAIALFPLGPFF